MTSGVTGQRSNRLNYGAVWRSREDSNLQSQFWNTCFPSRPTTIITLLQIFPGAAIFTLFHQLRPHRKPEIREHVTDVLWRRGWESNPQGRKDLPVFETGWHSRLRSSPYGGKEGTRTLKTKLSVRPISNRVPYQVRHTFPDKKKQVRNWLEPQSNLSSILNMAVPGGSRSGKPFVQLRWDTHLCVSSSDWAWQISQLIF